MIATLGAREAGDNGSPSHKHPERRIGFQPFLTSINVNLFSIFTWKNHFISKWTREFNSLTNLNAAENSCYGCQKLAIFVFHTIV